MRIYKAIRKRRFEWPVGSPLLPFICLSHAPAIVFPELPNSKKGIACMEDRLPRKLAAILYADVAGYSRLTGEDEDVTHRRPAEYLDQIAVTIERRRGRAMHYAGDAMIASEGSGIV